MLFGTLKKLDVSLIIAGDLLFTVYLSDYRKNVMGWTKKKLNGKPSSGHGVKNLNRIMLKMDIKGVYVLN